MEKQAEVKSISVEVWNIMQMISWIFYSLTVITFVLNHLNILAAKKLLTIPLNGDALPFGIPTLLFMMGAYIHIWSVYIEKKAKQKSDKNTFLPASGFYIGIAITALFVTIIITLIEG
jgi:hypothetical protein